MKFMFGKLIREFTIVFHFRIILLCFAGPTGFEPAILSLTGTRVNQATLRAQTLLFYYNQQTRVCTTANKGFWVYDQRGLLCKPEEGGGIKFPLPQNPTG